MTDEKHPQRHVHYDNSRGIKVISVEFLGLLTLNRELANPDTSAEKRQFLLETKNKLEGDLQLIGLYES